MRELSENAWVSRKKIRETWHVWSYAPAHTLGRQAGSSVWGSRSTRSKWTHHSWYTDPNFQNKAEQYNSQVNHHRPCRGREPCHRLGQGKSGRQRGTATDQMDKKALWIRKTLISLCMNRHAGSTVNYTWDQVISRSRAPSSCKQSRRDQDVRRTSKRCHEVTYLI